MTSASIRNVISIGESLAVTLPPAWAKGKIVAGFQADQSIQRVRDVEGSTLATKVLCGMELWRAKLNLGHSAWYPYLMKCGISPPTASRRKTLAVEFLLWAGIIREGVEIGEDYVIQGLNLIIEKPFNLNDFTNYKLAKHDAPFIDTFFNPNTCL